MQFEIKNLLRMGLALFLLAFLYLQGVPALVLVILGAMFFSLLLLRKKARGKAADFVESFLPFTRNWPGWAKAALVLAVFLAAYFVVKTVLFSLLKLLGLDVQAELAAALNASE